jgi:osmotically-inducible protein OsmY
MSREYSPTIDISLQLRVQVALDQWVERNCRSAGQHIFVLANPHGEITLRGQAANRVAGDAAACVARSVSGVRLVFNQITITRDCRPLVSALIAD